jgi:hypothetical protein
MLDDMPLPPETAKCPGRKGMYGMPLPHLLPDPRTLPRREEEGRGSRRKRRREEQAKGKMAG